MSYMSYISYIIIYVDRSADIKIILGMYVNIGAPANPFIPGISTRDGDCYGRFHTNWYKCIIYSAKHAEISQKTIQNSKLMAMIS